MMTITKLIQQGKELNASDIHICVGNYVQYRIKGTLVNLNNIILEEQEVKAYMRDLMDERLMEKLKNNLSVDFATTIDGDIRIRCNIYKAGGNYSCAIRILPYQIPTCDSLFIPNSIIDSSKKAKGLILVTGATSQGKSTTLAALIGRINQKDKKHIITLEDPIEYVHTPQSSVVNQREIGFDTLSFSSGLRDALRQDPDIILVGEMRDCETISTALTAAETGHLVLATLHTMDCASTISRIIDVFPPSQQNQISVMLADVLECVIAQKLILLKDESRRAVFEIMTGTAAIRSLIRDNKTFQLYSQMQMSSKDGMQTMDQSLLSLYKTGLVEVSNLLEAANDSAWLEKSINSTEVRGLNDRV